ncbi:uncharacterized protein LOC125480448 [Pyrus x bretschneideri]|uniref:uncharacterized protein LOC125480448 n=1 Tax=Pyrus x bretschneideri TaxID=225117 RepID=UPI00202E1A8F|nr:uncharacterized protein LOC125480448 [Pyrus x bretschneideri]
MAESDPLIKNHLQRFQNNEICYHYLSPTIQKELILLISCEIEAAIIQKVKEAKYFTVILDCTPNFSRQEQMTLIIRCVNVNSTPVKVEEYFLQYLIVSNTSGLLEELHNVLKVLDLDIDDVKGQCYDNGSNMKGRHQGVQKRLLDINPRAMYTPCGCHSLNLTLCNMENSCGKAKDFFGTVQQQVQGLITYFEKYIKTRFVEAMMNAKKLAIEMEIDPVLPEKCQRRFEEYQVYDDIFGFLFTSEQLNLMDNDKLKDCCHRLQNFLKKDELFDVDGDALLIELKLLQEHLPKEIKISIDILNYLKRMRCFPIVRRAIFK